MATFTGTAANETITPSTVSATVTRDPLGSLPSTAADTIYGNGGVERWMVVVGMTPSMAGQDITQSLVGWAMTTWMPISVRTPFHMPTRLQALSWT